MQFPLDPFGFLDNVPVTVTKGRSQQVNRCVGKALGDVGEGVGLAFEVSVHR
ncbi:MAG: hypothetical protein ACKO3L_02305 [Actinomycetota bacterium]